MKKKMLPLSNKHLLPLFAASLLVNIMAAPVWADDSLSLPIMPDSEVWAQPESPVLLYQPEVEGKMELASESIQPLADSSSDAPEVFYPTNGQSSSGYCWMGLMIDSNDNVYPVNGNGVSKILPDGTLVNGVGDQNYYSTGGGSYYPALDEAGGYFYTASYSNVRRALFSEGSTFSSLIPGLNGGRAITLGQGPLTGSLFATEYGAERVSRITLSPLGITTYASGISSPEAITSAPDGTLYVVSGGADPKLIQIPAATATPVTFAFGTTSQVNRAVIADNTGNVYWSHADGINKYDANGSLLDTLPGPPDKSAYGNPMGAAFDSKGNLYILDNFNCKEIYKYELVLPVTIDVKPDSFPNSVNPKSKGVIPVAVLTTDDFDATTIDPLSVKFGTNEAGEVHDVGHEEDVDGDGDIDLLLHFSTQATGIACGDTSVTLTGETFDGQTIQGTDSIQTVGCH